MSPNTRVAPAPPADERSAAGPATSLDAPTMRRRARHMLSGRRCLRLLSGLGICFGLVLAYMAHFYDWRMVTASMAYDPASGVAVVLDGCDLDIVAGNEALVTLTAHAAASEALVETVRDGISTVRATNRLDCSDLPHESCRLSCLVTLTVPPAAAAAAFTVRQLSRSGTSPWVTINSTAVALGSLTLGTASMPLPLAYVHLRSLIVSGALSAHMTNGFLRADRATLGGVTFHSSESASVYLYNLIVPSSSDAQVLYRQAMSRMCLATDLSESEAVIDVSIGKPSAT